jgi:catechol 2,3-dioxygenase-like lactoylglutathione lyase family enzyme
VLVLGIDHVQVAAPAGCEEQARRFYAELLGLVELVKPETLVRRGGCWFAAGAQQLHVGVDPDFVAAAKAHPCLLVADLAAARATLAQAGFPVEQDTAIEGTDRFFSTDPFGNRLEFRASPALV